MLQKFRTSHLQTHIKPSWTTNIFTTRILSWPFMWESVIHNNKRHYGFFDKKLQIDLVIIDCSKAFHRVPYKKPLHKILNYGINGNINNWIQFLITQRKQQVIIEGETSTHCSVHFSVPRGAVLESILFLCH